MFSRRLFSFSLVAVACSPPVRRSRPKGETQAAIKSGMERQLFDAVNSARVRERIPELIWHSGAALAAHAHSRAMAERGFFDHTDPQQGDLAERLNKAGIGWTSIAENLFHEQGHADPAGRAVQVWLKSAGHRRNLLNRTYTHTGIGAASDGGGTIYFTQIFLIPVKPQR